MQKEKMKKFSKLTAKLGLVAVTTMTTVTFAMATVENQLTQAVKPVAT